MYTVCLDSDDAFRRSLESNTACHSRLFGCYTPIYTLRDRFGNQYLLNSMLAAEPSGFYVDFISFSRTIDQCPDFQNHAFNPDRQQCGRSLCISRRIIACKQFEFSLQGCHDDSVNRTSEDANSGCLILAIYNYWQLDKN
jgi:hypothetical protein